MPLNTQRLPLQQQSHRPCRRTGAHFILNTTRMLRYRFECHEASRYYAQGWAQVISGARMADLVKTSEFWVASRSHATREAVPSVLAVFSQLSAWLPASTALSTLHASQMQPASSRSKAP